MGAERTSVTGQQSPEQLQAQLDQTRESISKTVTEIQDTMTTEYNTVKTNLSEKLDWRQQVRQHPMAFSLGALAIGLLIGRGLSSNMSSDTDMDSDDEFFGSESMAPRQRSHRTSRIVSSVRQSNAFHQVADGLSTVMSELVNELVKVGREQIIPNVVGRVSTSLGVDDQTGSGMGSGTGTSGMNRF
jgi:hypothetical protein